MFTLHATKKLLDRVGAPPVAVPPDSTTRLGNWYGTLLFWRPQIVLLVNERTLLPVLLPFAPSADLMSRIPGEVAALLGRLGIGPELIAAERDAMWPICLAKTANRRLLGMLNEFAFQASIYARGDFGGSLSDIALRLSDTPCGPIAMNRPGRIAREVLETA